MGEEKEGEREGWRVGFGWDAFKCQKICFDSVNVDARFDSVIQINDSVRQKSDAIRQSANN